MSKAKALSLLLTTPCAVAFSGSLSHAAFLLLVLIFGQDGINQALLRLAPVLAPVVTFLSQLFSNPVAIAILA